MSKRPAVSSAYDDALEHLGRIYGFQTAMVVRAVIISKGRIAQLERTIADLSIGEELKSELIAAIVSEISENVAVMCTIIEKEFKTDILPLVNNVTGNNSSGGSTLQ